MADILSIPRQGYAKYENSLGEPDISTLTKLADYFNINVDSILGRHSNCGNLNLDSTKLSSFYE
ncbi:hypothetical protein AN161_18070 [Lysinibacillus sp. FJAT-14222]|nr:hypothetical protein AN161_18070 [Lysinibacillus sp. FJAT-14222]